ncbi:DUF1176 domain-containing protein [Spartinivicinus poritis]|uniref:DUF1176 domain-containing protein n=1 Tax=Spartinivicinus poritis TaxID=2994640 RepID=A0ABT5UGE7_9GAMM|nr:DUF1176 domain-containing protein [Spartinivicinus sp. A2-2]MDE1465454.1 DUF1176 domain-containing protein [Spartinivicinus sp. A2-2]
MLIKCCSYCVLAMFSTIGYSLEGITFEHKDWYLACDNSGTCRAAGYTAEGESHRSSIAVMLTREAGEDAQVKGKIFIEEKAGHFDSLTLTINKKNWGGLVSDGALSLSQVKALLDALPKKNVNVVFNDGNTTWELSDKGASAIFRKMDEFQQRLNTPGALVVKGNQAQKQLLAPQSIPQIKFAKVHDEKTTVISLDDNRYRELLIELIKNTDKKACEVEKYVAYKDDFFSKMEFAELNDNQAIVKMLCWHGAYNYGYGVWLINTNKPYNPKLVTDSATYYQAGRVGRAHKGRGLGDCFDHEEWVFDGSGFQLAQAFDTGLCRSVAGGGIDPMYTFISNIIKD